MKKLSQFKASQKLVASRKRLALTVIIGVAIAFFPVDLFSEESNVSDEAKATKQNESKEEIDYRAISKSEWKKRLSSEQFKVAREHGTERPFSGKYHAWKKDGAFKCVCCGTVLFDSKAKFDSGTGWPSFWAPQDKEMVGESTDHKLGYPRTEVHCNVCDAHLGHVFDDAPQTPTGLRYCINSVCIVFVPRDSTMKSGDK